MAVFFFQEKRSSTRVCIHEVFTRSHAHVCKNNLHVTARAIILTYADWTYATQRTQQSALVKLDELNTRFIPMYSNSRAE